MGLTHGQSPVACSACRTPHLAKGQITDGIHHGGHHRQRPDLARGRLQTPDRRLQQRRGSPSVRCRRRHRLRAEHPHRRLSERQARDHHHHLPRARRQHHRDRRPHPSPQIAFHEGFDSAGHRHHRRARPHHHDPRLRAATWSGRWCSPSSWSSSSSSSFCAAPAPPSFPASPFPSR